MKIKISQNCFKIDKPNFTALTKGFTKNGKRIQQAIWCDVKRKQYPTLFTLQKSRARYDYPLSDVGIDFNDVIRPKEYFHVADIVEEYFIENTIELWERLCNNGLFDIWLPEAPFNRFKNAKTDPSQYRIVLLRVYEIKENFSTQDIISSSPYLDKIKDTSKLFVTIKRPVIDDIKFKELKELLESTLYEFKARPQKNIPPQISEVVKSNEFKTIITKTEERPIIKYFKINNFKILDIENTITFSPSTTVIIGPNNSGKTSILQAIVLWQRCIKTWYEELRNGHISNTASGAIINKFSLTASLVEDVKLLWKNTNVKNGNENIVISITIGLFFQNEIIECTVTLRYENKELIYAYINENISKNKHLVQAISDLDVKILYPISKIKETEDQFTEQAVQAKIEAGFTNEVLMNMCYYLFEKNKHISKDSNNNMWQLVCKNMRNMFGIELSNPDYRSGTVRLTYKPYNTDELLPISLAGTGQQQMLALLTFFGYQENGVVMFDEPDAHFESLRQRQVFNLLKYLAEINKNQLIISTHSEVIINESAELDINLIVGGDVIKLSDSAKQISFFIKDFGMDHYYKAKLKQSVLYAEGSTDVEMLKKFAEILNHNAFKVLDSDFYFYPVRDNIQETNNLEYIFRTPENKLIEKYEKHYQGIKLAIPNFKGLGIFDSDNIIKTDEITEDKAIVYWKKYELENYFVSVESIKLFVFNEFQNYEHVNEGFNNAIDKSLRRIFSIKDYDVYKTSQEETKKVLFNLAMKNEKGSKFLDFFFSEFHKYTGTSINKGEYYKIIPYAQLENEVQDEITEKLDLIVKYIKCTQHAV